MGLRYFRNASPPRLLHCLPGFLLPFAVHLSAQIARFVRNLRPAHQLGDRLPVGKGTQKTSRSLGISGKEGNACLLLLI
jgi:hypothetical protein